jgi:Cu+-exporting ATPase
MKCYHCGDECRNTSIYINDKYFCCNGCKTVFQLLSDNKLYKYYELESTPGIRDDDSLFTGKYNYLDKADIKSKFLLYEDETYAKAKFFIPGIHCSSCIWLLENLNKLNSKILYSQVHFPKKEITISFNPKEISLNAIAELLESIHYKPNLNYNQDDTPERIKSNRRLIYQLGIAGFCFGNIMLLSFPEYFSRKGNLYENYNQFFNYLNFILSIPVLLYSATDYFSAALKGFKKKIVSIDLPIAIGIVALFVQSTYNVFFLDIAGYFDSLAGLVFFLLIGKWYQSKTYRALSFDRDYRSYFPLAVTRIIDDEKEEETSIHELQKNDEILIRNNEIIPADSTLLSSFARIDYSFVTGESELIEKQKDAELFAGGRNVGNYVRVKVKRSVSQSYLTQLWTNQSANSNKETQWQSYVDKIARYFTLAVILIATVSFFVWFRKSPVDAVRVFTSVLIVACPCALALTIPFAYGTVIRVLGKWQFYLNSIQIVEKLSRIKHIVFDKTGTLTKTEMSVTEYKGKELADDQLHTISAILKSSTHPLSRSLVKHLNRENNRIVCDFNEIAGEGIIASCDGSSYKIGSAAHVGINKEISPEITAVHISVNDTYFGYFSFNNQYREGLKDSISALNEKFELHVLSGDNEKEKPKIQALIGHPKNIHFNKKPHEKRDYIKSLREGGNEVLMVGDGLNDAGALMESDVGVSVTEQIFQFVPSCDIIMKAKNLKYLSGFISLAKRSLNVVKLSLMLSFMYNIVGISWAISGNLSPLVAAILMPISSVSVVAFVSLAVVLQGRRTVV